MAADCWWTRLTLGLSSRLTSIDSELHRLSICADSKRGLLGSGHSSDRAAGRHRHLLRSRHLSRHRRRAKRQSSRPGHLLPQPHPERWAETSSVTKEETVTVNCIENDSRCLVLLNVLKLMKDLMLKYFRWSQNYFIYLLPFGAGTKCNILWQVYTKPAYLANLV